MARMHSRRKGKSGSKKPIKKSKPTWIRYKAKEIELLASKLAKENKTPSQIGIVLRDVYGIPDIKLIAGRTLTEILKEKGLLKELPQDVIDLMKHSVALKKHMGANKKDMTAKHGLMLNESKIKRLIKYYKRTGRIAVEWKYDQSKLKMYTE